jgi:phenylalanyl-tRNA synthetase alpha subunit
MLRLEDSAMILNKLTPIACCVIAISWPASGQTPAAPVSYSSISELNQMVSSLQEASQSAQQDLSHLRIEKWKTDSGTKKQTESNVESIQRNLQTALPGILADLKNSPENGPLTFKVYRNLNALYDVMSSVVESAGAFGNKEEFQNLSKDLGAIEDSRRSFAERMDKVTNAKETEIAQLRTALQAARAEAQPKKVVVDDTVPPPPKKPAQKKKSVPKPNSANPHGQPAGASTPH